MTIASGYSRDELRRAYADAWRKQASGALLTPLEASIAAVIALHPEYHALIADADRALAFESGAGGDRENPFLHMGLHLAVRDQLKVDRPPGVRALHAELQVRHGSVHAAEHALMQALAETLWTAQRDGTPPDEQRYLALARRGIAT